MRFDCHSNVVLDQDRQIFIVNGEMTNLIGPKILSDIIYSCDIVYILRNGSCWTRVSD